MEFLIGAAVIILLLLILGVPPAYIIAVLLGLIALLLVVMLGFFIVTLILTLISKPYKGKFLRIVKHEVVGTYAIYEIDGEEYKNTFPAEITLTDKIYHKGRLYPLRLHKGKRKYMLYDWYSWIVIGVGLLLSGGGIGLMIWIFMGFMAV